MAKAFLVGSGFFGMIIAAALVSSPVSTKADSHVILIGDHDIYSTTELVFSEGVSKYAIAELDYQVIEIPRREIAYPEIVGTVKQADPSEVRPVANSPPAV